MTRYALTFQNDTAQVWTISVFRLLDGSSFDTVSWQQCIAPPGQLAARGGYCHLEWDDTDSVVLGHFDVVRKRYQPRQVLPAQRGSEWEVVFQDGVQQLLFVGETTDREQIKVHNRSGDPASVGTGWSGKPMIYRRDLASGVSVSLPIAPVVLQIGLFERIAPGEVVPAPQVGPLVLAFPSGKNLALATVAEQGGAYSLAVSYERAPSSRGSPGGRL